MRVFFDRFKVQLALATGVLAGFAAALAVSAVPARADIDLGDIVKSGVKIVGISAIVSKYDNQIDDAINKLLDNNKCGTGAATRVVTIISPLGRKYIGAAQVVGPKAQVEKVKSVIQLEQSFMGKQFRIKAMVPADSKDPTSFHRVDGVGVSAVIDVKI